MGSFLPLVAQSFPRPSSEGGEMLSIDPSNAALEWQAGGLGFRSRVLEVACPLEGLVSRYFCEYTHL
jgi:hypothetical protein